MESKIYLIYTCFLAVSPGFLVSAKKELKLLHVVSTNKFNVPVYNYSSTTFEIPTNFSYKYYLEHGVDMPNSVKLHLFNLGAHLRSMYDSFLGSMYTDDVIRMQTTEYPASIMAGELINAGLWPPVGQQVWKDDLLWQPIPFEYELAADDTLLLGTLCPNFIYETKNVLKRTSLTSEQANVLKHINKEAHLNLQNSLDVNRFHLAVENSVELKQTHPKWLKEIYPSDSFLNVSLSSYNLLSTTIVQKRLNGGSLLKNIINDSKNHIKGILSSNRKINIYSGDDRIFAGLLHNLNIPFHDLPQAGASIIFELFEEESNYFIKIGYFTGSSNETLPFKLQDCELFCPIETFSELVADVLPANDLSLCGSLFNNSENSASQNSLSNIFITILYLCVLYISTRIL